MRDKLNKMHDDDELSWRKIAALPQFAGIVAAGTLCSYAKGGYEPKDESIRLALELPVYETLELCENCVERFRRRG